MDDRTAQECLWEILEDAAEDLRAGAFDVGAPFGVGRSRR
jgi:hypothetical protein